MGRVGAFCVALGLYAAALGGALECDPRFWPDMVRAPRRYEALILLNGALVKLCFDSGADGSVLRARLGDYAVAAGLFTLGVDGDASDVGATVEQLVNVAFFAKMRRWNPTWQAEVGESAAATPGERLRPDARFSLTPGQVETPIVAALGESAASAAARSCAALVGAFLHDAGDCRVEAEREIARVRGFHSTLDGEFNAARKLLETYVRAIHTTTRCAPAEPCAPLQVEGGTYHYPFKLNAMRNLLRGLVAHEAEDVLEVCEVGFNFGHSSLLWLLEPRVRVRSFDLGEHWYAAAARDYLRSAYGLERLEVIFGDSSATLAAFAAEFASESPPAPCALIFVDGGHDYDTALGDILTLRAAARPRAAGGHVLLVDDPNHDAVGDAWLAAADLGAVEHVGDIFEDAHAANVFDAHAAMLYGVYAPREGR